MYISFWLFLWNVLGTYIVQRPAVATRDADQAARSPSAPIGEKRPVHP